MKIVKINVQSDVFHQVKPSKLSELQELVGNGSKHSMCNMIRTVTVPMPPHPNEIWAAHYLRFTNQQVYDLLTKALSIVKDTEEYVTYQLNQTFGNNKDKSYSTPPGTVRIYDHDLICFYNGKTWRKLKP